MATFADRLRQLRKEKGITQEKLAERFFITKSAVSKYETGVNTPENKLLQDMADFFEVSVDYLLGRSDEKYIIIDEPEISLHEQYANKITKLLEDEGLEYTEDTIPEIISFSKYILSKKKKQD